MKHNFEITFIDEVYKRYGFEINQPSVMFGMPLLQK